MKSILQVFSFDLLSKILTGMIAILIIRYMPETDYALYVLALAIITIPVQIIGSFFNKVYIIGFKKFKISANPSSFLGLILLTLLAVLFAGSFFKAPVQEIYWLIVGVVIANVFSDFSKTFYQREMQFKIYSAIELTRSVLILAGLLVIIWYVRYNLDVSDVLILRATVLLVLFFVVYAKKLELKKIINLRYAYSSLRLIVKDNYKFLFGYILLLALFLQTDVFMLKGLSDTHSLASYGSAFRYYTLISLALGAIQAVLLPMINEVNTKEEIDNILKKHKRLILLFIPSILLGAWLAIYIIPFVDKGKYPNAVTVFQIFSISSIISVAFSPHVNFILKCERFRFLFVLMTVCLLINILLNVTLIPKYNALGAAAATTFSYALLNVTIYLKAKKLISRETFS